ncbi:MAG: hypothetical protein U0174_03260 [Polyangiaceae bacterium]
MRIFASHRENLQFRSECTPAAATPSRPVTQLYALLEGELSVSFGARELSLEAPALVRLPESWAKGACGERTAMLETRGRRFRAVQITYRVPSSSYECLELPSTLLGALTRYASAVLDEPREGFGAAPERECLRALEVHGLLDRETIASADEGHDESMVRLWNAFRPLYAATDALPSLKALAGAMGLSRRHSSRLVAEFAQRYLLPPGGFQELFHDLRLALSSLLLSDRNLSVGEVASIVGYARQEALAGAYRRAGLPTPKEIRRSYSRGANDTSPA